MKLFDEANGDAPVGLFERLQAFTESLLVVPDFFDVFGLFQGGIRFIDRKLGETGYCAFYARGDRSYKSSTVSWRQ